MSGFDKDTVILYITIQLHLPQLKCTLRWEIWLISVLKTICNWWKLKKYRNLIIVKNNLKNVWLRARSNQCEVYFAVNLELFWNRSKIILVFRRGSRQISNQRNKSNIQLLIIRFLRNFGSDCMLEKWNIWHRYHLNLPLVWRIGGLTSLFCKKSIRANFGKHSLSNLESASPKNSYCIFSKSQK